MEGRGGEGVEDKSATMLNWMKCNDMEYVYINRRAQERERPASFQA